MMILISALIVILLTQNSQWIYGGYKGSLEVASKKLIDRQSIDLEGRLQFKGGLEDTVVEELETSLVLGFDGSIYPSEHMGDFDLFVTSSEGILRTKIGRLYMTKENCRFVSENTGEDINIPLEDLLTQWQLLFNPKAMDERALIDHFYERASVNKAIISDSRSGYKQLKRSIVAYTYEENQQLIRLNLDESANIISLIVRLDLEGAIVMGEIYIK